MLVLTRRIGEEIVIDGTITIKVLATKSGGVRLGVSAPPDVRVDRQEVFKSRRDAPHALASPEPVLVS